MWDVLERDLTSSSTLPSSTKDLEELLMKLWSKLSVEIVFMFIESMRRRMRSVIRGKDGPTQY